MLFYERAVRALAGLIPAQQQLDIFFALYGANPSTRSNAVGNPKPQTIQFDINNLRMAVQGIRPTGIQARVFDEAMNALKPLLPKLANPENRVELINQYTTVFFGLRKQRDLALAAMQGLRQRRYTDAQLDKFMEVAVRYNQYELVDALFDVGYRVSEPFARDLIGYAMMRWSLQTLKILVEFIGWDVVSSWSVVSMVATRQDAQGRNILHPFTYTQHDIRQAVSIATGIDEEALVEKASAVANFDTDQQGHRARVVAFERSLIQFAASGLIDAPPQVIRDDGILYNDELHVVANTIGRTLAEVKSMHLEELAPEVARFAVLGANPN